MDDVIATGRSSALTSARRGTRCASWRAHAALLGAVGAYIGVSALQSTTDANIGLGLGLLSLAALGAPWSGVLLLVDGADGADGADGMVIDSGAFAAVAFSAAMLNPVLHALLLGRWTAR